MGTIVQILLIWRHSVKKLAVIHSAPGASLDTRLAFILHKVYPKVCVLVPSEIVLMLNLLKFLVNFMQGG